MRSSTPLGRLVLLALFLIAPGAAAQDPAALARGRTLNRWLMAGPLDSLFAVLSPTFQNAIGGRDGLTALQQRLAQVGAEQAVTTEAVYHEAGYTTYYRLSRFEHLPDVTTRWVWDASGTVLGAQIVPTPQPAPTQYLAYETKADLQFPLSGNWYVAWGGRVPHENYHVVAPDQRFAYDLVKLVGEALFRTDGSTNEDYYGFGEPVFAPAAGTVVTAVDTVADNARPGVKNPGTPPPGNYVVIDHGNGEYSLLAHFQHGTVAVQPGQHVAAGDVLGRVGNSGNSDLPHLHYHLQTGPAYRDGVGLPAFFNAYEADGVAVLRGEPHRGQTIRDPHTGMSDK